MDKWAVFIDHQGERANTLFDTEEEAWAFAKLLERFSSFDSVYVRRVKGLVRPAAEGEDSAP